MLRRTGADSAAGSSSDASENQAMPHAMTTFPAVRPASGHLSELMCVPQKFPWANLTAKLVGERAAEQLRSHIAIQEGRLDNALPVQAVI